MKMFIGQGGINLKKNSRERERGMYLGVMNFFSCFHLNIEHSRVVLFFFLNEWMNEWMKNGF